MEEFKYVSENSSYVRINYDKVLDFVNLLNEPKYSHWSSELNLNLKEEEWILFAFVIESMNFCFWIKTKWKIEYNGEVMSGSNALFYSVIKEIELNPKFLDIDYLSNLSKDKLKNIFNGVEGEIPLFDERYKNFKETVSFIKNNKNFYKELYSFKSDILLEKYITDNLSSFDDKSEYKNHIIHFNKRANLLVNDLYYLSFTIKKNLGNVNNLSGCADYGIPRTFRDYGILEYSESLKELVDNEKEIPHNSCMEIEIRANMLYVIELIKNELKKKNVIINSVELDNLIWVIGKKNQTKKSVPHHTITIFY